MTMVLRNTSKLAKGVASQISATLLSRLIPRSFKEIWPWVFVVLTGLMLGIYITLLPKLGSGTEIRKEFDISSRTWSLLLIMSGLSPFAGIILARFATHLRRLLLIAILLEIPVQFDYRLGYSELEQRFGTVSGFTVSITTICLVILYGWWLVEILSKWKAPPQRSLLRLILPSIVYVAILILSIIIARSPLAAFNWCGLVLQAFLLYAYLIHYIRTREDLLFVATLLTVGLLLSSMVMIGFGVTGAGGGSDPLAIERGNSGVSRVGGTLADPNLAGSYLAMAVVFVFSLYAIADKRWFKLLVTVSFGMGGLALLWTGSRGSWVSAVIGVTALGFFLLRKRWLPLKIPIFFSILVGIIVLIAHEPILERLFSEQADKAAASRVPLMIIAIRMIKDYFLFGVGANNFAYYLRDYVTAEMYGYWIRTVHNQYLLTWAENGIIGLGAFVWFLLATLRLGWQAWREGYERFLSVIALGATASVFAAAIHMTGEKYHARVQVEMVFLMAGIVTAAYRLWAAAHWSQLEQVGVPLSE